MKNYLLIFILISVLFFIKCDDNDDDFNYKDYEGNPDNINIESISYELTYNNYSVVKVVIKTYDEIESDISFIAYLKSREEKKEYILNCSSTFYDIIECLSERNVTFNIDDSFYFYYNKTKSKFSFDENDILEDDKQISLVFKPEISIKDRLFRDKRKIYAQTDGNMVGGGFLYITRKSKDVLNKPKNGFNKYIELNNIIPHIGFHHDIPISTLIGYKKAIKRGYKIVDAIIRFTKDKIPVVSHEDNLEIISNGKGKINNFTYSELLKLDFGTKIDPQYRGETILSLQILLQLCKELNIIVDIDLSQLDYDEYFGKDNTYIYKLLNSIAYYNMFNSVYFTDVPDSKNILKLKEHKKDISIAIQSLTNKETLEKSKGLFNNSKEVILNTGDIYPGTNLSEETIKTGKSLGKKIKVGIVDDAAYAEKIQQWGVNFIKTKSLPSFLAENDKEDPIVVRCVPIDGETSECEIEDDVFLKDNEWYNIYYSENIYNVSEDIHLDPIGEFQYIDTNILDELYYKVNTFNYERGIISLNLSEKLKKGEEAIGIVGPENYDNVPECYQFNFICEGNDEYQVNCRINKNEEGKIEYQGGKYQIYYLEDYSLNEYETDERSTPQESYYEYIVEEKKSYFLTCCIIIAIILVGVIIYCTKCRKRSEVYNRIRIADNNYLSDNYLYR